jgi:hypothetical protein
MVSGCHRQRTSEPASPSETAAEEGRGAVRATKESHRSSSPALVQVEVRPRAVLPGGHCPGHQTSGTVPQPASNTAATRHCLAERKEDTLPSPRTHQPQNTRKDKYFSTPTTVITP